VTPERAQRALAARRARITRIRKAVATASIVIFVALFSAIYVQMATGRDPALAAQSTTKSTSSTAAASPSTSTSDPSSGTDSENPGPVETAPSTSLTPMTTSQS
jgi:hypothetical protein